VALKQCGGSVHGWRWLSAESDGDVALRRVMGYGSGGGLFCGGLNLRPSAVLALFVGGGGFRRNPAAVLG
jgi:hypothetical protein